MALRLKWGRNTAKIAGGIAWVSDNKHGWWNWGAYWKGVYMHHVEGTPYISDYAAKRACERWLTSTGIMGKILEGRDGT